MAISHHDREEETLIAYFQQMLADVDDEEFAGEIQSSSGDMSAAPVGKAAADPAANHKVLASANAAIEAAHQHNPVAGMEHITTQEMVSHELSIADETEVIDNPLAGAYEPQMQLQSYTADDREFATPEKNDSLQRLLASITPDTAVKTVVAEPEVKVETAVQTPDTAVKTVVAVPEAKVETAVAAPEVKVEIAHVEPAVAVQTPEVKVEPAVKTAVAAPEVKVESAVKTAAVAVQTKQVVKNHEQLVQERMESKLRSINSEWKNVDLGQQFQALFFLAQGVRFAVPLIDLGGIFECDKITQLFGKPSWFMGITDVRGSKINIVDTLRWVMPEIGESPDKYPYLIALGTSQWAIGCDVLEGNRSLSADQVKWREIPGSRPWLAGIVTSDKCALLHVNALISLFNAGANIEDLVREFEEGQSNDNKGK